MALGRFSQPDPIVPEPGNPQSLNRYAYARNNPLKYTDPTGHMEICSVAGEGCGEAHTPLLLPPPAVCHSVACLPTPMPYPTPTPLVLVGPTPYAGPYITTQYGHDANQGQGEIQSLIRFSTGMQPFVATTVIPVDRKWLVPVAVPYRSGMEGSVTYYENGTYVVVSDRYDTEHLFVAGLNLSLSRSVGIETTSGERFNYPLGTVPPGQAGDTAADPITVWIRREQGITERIRMNLAVQGMAAKGPAIAWSSYYITIPLPGSP